MGKQIFNFKGMMRDLSVSKNPSNYAYEIRNMRLTAQEDSTLLSLVTEKGNREFAVKDASNNPVALDNIIGYCVIDKYLTVFTHKVENTSCIDSIVRLEEKYPEGSSISYMEAKVLYTGDLDLYPDKGVEIDALGCYENENLIKVYWVDSVHQPRLINIMASDDEISSWSDMETPFDFIPALGFNEEVSIQKVNYNGLFAPGTLQYVLTYYKRNGQQSNSFYTSPLYYTAHSNRGGSPEETVSNAFEIKVYNPDTAFDFVRVYSVLRTSQDDAPVCKRVYDIPLSTITSHYEGKRYFVDETPLHPSSWTHFQMQTYTSIDYIKIIKQDSVTNYTEFPLEDFLYSVNGTERQYYIPYGYYVMTHFNLNTNPMTSCYVWKPQDEAFGLFIKYDFVSSTPTVAWMASVSVSNGIVDTTTFNEEDILETDFIFAHYGISEEYVSFIDNGMYGESCSLEEVIYAGGQVILPKTLAQKNNTLFLGNYKLHGHSFTNEDKESIKTWTSIYFGYSNIPINKGEVGSFYTYKNQLDLSSKEITTFKGGEYYNFGLIFQDKYGQWSDVVPLDTVKNNLYPIDYDTEFYPVKVFIRINENAKSILNEFVNVKIVMQDTYNTVICQGVLSPTVFNYERKDGNTYAMPSWYFRDIEAYKPSCILTNNRPQARHYHNIWNNYSPIITDTTDINATQQDVFNVCEVQYASQYDYWYYTPNLIYNDYDMYVDWNIINMYGPDIEQSNYMRELFKNSKMRIVGMIPFTSCISSRSITTDTSAKWYEHSLIEDVNIRNNSISNSGYELELSDYVYTDKNVSNVVVKYPIYPWHRNISLHGQDSADDDKWYSALGIKIMASLRSSCKNFFITSNNPIFSYKNVYRYNKEDGLPVGIELFNGNIGLYNGQVDMLLSTPAEKSNYCIIGSNPPSADSTQNAGTSSAVPIKYKSTSHLVTQLYEQFKLPVLPNVYVNSTELALPEVENDTYYTNTYLKLPIITVSSQNIFLDTGMVYKSWGYFTAYEKFYTTNVTSGFPFISSNVFLEIDNTYPEYAYIHVGDFVLVKTNNDIILCIVAKKTSSIKKLRAVDHNDIAASTGWREDEDGNLIRIPNPLENFRTFESTGNQSPLISQSFYTVDGTTTENSVEWRFNGTQYFNTCKIKCYYVDSSGTKLLTLKYNHTKYNYIAEKWRNGHWVNDGNMDFPYVYPNGEGKYIASPMYILVHNGYDVDNDIPVGTSNMSVVTSSLAVPSGLSGFSYTYLAEFYEDNVLERNNNEKSWLPCGDAYSIDSNIIIADTGDTYYQRYDCLKTYPYTHEDPNQIIEILSFMCETRINIDGRYDTFRGLADSTFILEEKFNLCNLAYTQKNNIFSYHYLDSNLFSNDTFPNRILWTKTKNYGEEIDSWTQIQTISELDMDGILGPVSTLRLFNDNLLCWQSKGLARIQYNERNAISTSSGVPVELANSGKVDGKNYISTSVGTDNMMSVQITPTGVYFVDTNTKDIYQFSGDGLVSISKAKGFNTYMNNSSLDLKRSRTFYDPKLQDVYFENVFTSKTECLVFNEQLKEFTSFFDYDMSFLFPLQDSIIATKGSSLYKQFDGDYLEMFGNVKNYSIEFIANEYSLYDKMFTNFELRADVLNPDTGALVGTTTPYTSSANLYPFKTIKVWNEYQDTGNVNFEEMIRKGTNMSQRFRIWRGDIPRNLTNQTHRFDRIRNTWARVKFIGDNKKIKTVLHDVNIIYYQ